ncbi:MAG: L-seryl-tRNA(Sec) selenium transferase [Solirubrobacterales bacterium]|nr:L-seryl-tRNA(Sec) selenium transferase [Solirubrobacterales bacterium]
MGERREAGLKRGRGDPPGDADRLRALPAVHELAAELDAPHAVAVAAARRAIAQARAALSAGELPVDGLEQRLLRQARAALAELTGPSLRRVLNATGVIVHTNLGRAPLAAAAREAVARAAAGYSNLELELAGGARGSRHRHVERLLCELTGAEAAMVVNNGAGAVLLAVAALAGPGRGVVVSRGQLVEIGGGFRIPEVVAQSGSELIEVGTTNRTRTRDFERALAAAPGEVGAILRVHQSNFRTLGFVEQAPLAELCGLGAAVIDDVGSGVLANASGILALGEEPSIKESIRAGAALVCCSGDKLLGGPQAGLLMGGAGAVGAALEHPLARALRIDKLSLAALEATLRLYREPARAREQIPVLAMLDASDRVLSTRAELIRAAIGPEAELIRATAKVGGGALPLTELEGPAVALVSSADPAALAGALRAGDPPVIARIHDGRVLLDPRTLTDEEAQLVAAAAARAVADARAG